LVMNSEGKGGLICLKGGGARVGKKKQMTATRGGGGGKSFRQSEVPGRRSAKKG